MTDPCQHLRLTRTIVGETAFYKCDFCRRNFYAPELIEIKVSYPEPRAEDRQ